VPREVALPFWADHAGLAFLVEDGRGGMYKYGTGRLAGMLSWTVTAAQQGHFDVAALYKDRE